MISDVTSWKVGSLKKGCSEKIVRKQVSRAHEHSRESLLEKVKLESNQKKLTLNITYYPIFQNIRNILQELHILLTPDHEHKKVFQDIPVVGFRNGESLKDHLVRAKLPNVEKRKRKRTAMFVTLYAIQTPLPPKPVVKHLKYKVEYLTVTLRRSFIF